MAVLDRLNFAIDLEDGAPLQQQIRERLIHAIATGVLQPGARVPSSRTFARQLGVSRNTVLIVYSELTSEGYLISAERSGLFVAEHLAAAASRNQAIGPSATPEASPRWRALIKRRSRIDWSRRIPPDWALHPYPFLEDCMDSELSFIGEWRDASRAAFTAHEFNAWSREFAEGDDEKLLHEVRTKILPRRGVEARDDEVLIVEGWKQGLDLIVQLFVDAKRPVAIEEPGLPEVRELLRLQRAGTIAQPVDSEGLVVDGRLDHCELVVVSPRRHAPTGVAMTRQRQKQLLRKMAANDGLVVELDLSSGAVNDSPAPALKSIDDSGRVLHVSNLCDVFGTGLRLGMVVAPAEIIRELRKLRSLMAGPAPRAAQRLGALLISLGHHDTAAAKVRRAIGERLTALRDALNYYLPRLVLIDPKLSGASIWVTGPPGLDATLLAKEAATRGVLIEPAKRFFHDQRSGANAFRMGVSSLPLGRIRAGVAELAKVIHELTDPALDRLDKRTSTWLTSEELWETMPNTTLLCRTAYGDPYSVEVHEDGRLVGKAGYAHEDCDVGVWWIEGDHWCRRWENWSYGETAKFLTVLEGDQIRWYKDDLILFNRGIIVRDLGAGEAARDGATGIGDMSGGA